MQVKDLSVKSEQLEEVRGGTYSYGYSLPQLAQVSFNGDTKSESTVFGGYVNSPVTSTSTAVSNNITSQSASISKRREEYSSLIIDGSFFGFD